MAPDLPLRIHRGPGQIDLIIDSSGLAIFGEGEWAAVKHGGKGIQGWRKLHLGVDETAVTFAYPLRIGVVLAQIGKSDEGESPVMPRPRV